MHNLTKGLIITLCATTTIFALKETGKTTLILRDHQHRAANFTIFHALQPQKENRFGSIFQNTFFYHETQNSKKLGKVFGVNGTNRVVVGTDLQAAAGIADIENNFLLHYHSSPNSLEGIIEFNPKQTAYGTSVETCINLDKILDGLYIKKRAVVIEVKNDLGATVYNREPGATNTEVQLLSEVLKGKNLKRNLGGGVSDRYSEQEALQYAKIGCSDKTRTGLENLEFIIGWKFLKKDDFYAGINLATQTPTGNRTTAEYLWEPRVGSQHWALGGGIEAGATLWQNKDQSIKLLFEFNYRYQLEAKEKRTLGICSHPLSHYYLLGEVGKYMLYPSANILTKDVDVTPGNNIDSFLVFNYNIHKFTIDLGYNFFYKDKEKVTLNRCDWVDDKYGIAQFNWKTCSNAFTPANMQPVSTPINFDNIDTSVAQSPSMLSHSIFGSIGCLTTIWDMPLALALGGAYEFGDYHCTADSFTLWMKAGLSF